MSTATAKLLSEWDSGPLEDSVAANAGDQLAALLNEEGAPPKHSKAAIASEVKEKK